MGQYSSIGAIERLTFTVKYLLGRSRLFWGLYGLACEVDAPSPSTAAGRGGDCTRFLPMLIEVEGKAVNEITGQSLKVIISTCDM